MRKSAVAIRGGPARIDLDGAGEIFQRTAILAHGGIDQSPLVQDGIVVGPVGERPIEIGQRPPVIPRRNMGRGAACQDEAHRPRVAFRLAQQGRAGGNSLRRIAGDTAIDAGPELGSELISLSPDSMLLLS